MGLNDKRILVAASLVLCMLPSRKGEIIVYDIVPDPENPDHEDQELRQACAYAGMVRPTLESTCGFIKNLPEALRHEQGYVRMRDIDIPPPKVLGRSGYRPRKQKSRRV